MGMGALFEYTLCNLGAYLSNITMLVPFSAILLSMSGLAAAGHFSKTCTDIKWDYKKHTLLAKCDGKGASLDLNKCFKAYPDAVKFEKDGNAFSRWGCHVCLLYEGHTLTCICGKESKNAKLTTIELDDYITNRKGKLECSDKET
ncbi:hypothetical protein BDV25DRAFT_136553 [Aspergillus avenaceus]|uniref:Cyanovirin-N domain-containing protein n=1 Tax=Aspergillus avenaceus TaxID=36643 RepID=A0A5N6U588_ASPAV|nr:hypothetical protein BDV25DRAFT_136553 [Aspergillus avenaceus]